VTRLVDVFSGRYQLAHTDTVVSLLVGAHGYSMMCVFVCRKRNKDEEIISHDLVKKRETKMSKEEESREQRKREKEAARAYEHWLNRKVCDTTVKDLSK